jgi:symplekin
MSHPGGGGSSGGEAASTTKSATDHVKQLSDARKQVLANPKLYSSVVKGVVPLLANTGASQHLSIRRWTAEFVAETFATPALPTREKDVLAPFVLDTIQTIVENAAEDTQVLRSMMQTAASLYPIALRWM